MIVFDDTKPWDEKLAIYRHVAKLIDGLPVLQKSEVEFIDVPQSEPLKEECQHFLSVVEEKNIPLTDGEEGLKVLNVLKSASLGV